jgi:ribonuclease PH
MTRADGRKFNQLRPVKIHTNFVSPPAGAVLIEAGNTRVVCAASIEPGVPRWMRDQNASGGWITAEYSMLPYSTAPRKQREITRGRIDGRTQEIQRLIGRALRAVTNLDKLGDRTVWIDCDVLQADGGTRTVAITGSSVALALAMRKLLASGELTKDPVESSVAAVSVGILDGALLLDLNYEEDAKAAVDMNVVMTGSGQLVEVQGTGEDAPFEKKDFNRMLKLAEAGIKKLLAIQQKALGQ